MSLWSNLFGKSSNEYVYLREAFSNHHFNIEQDLNRNHPHAAGILSKYGVDLKQVRQRAAKVVATAAVAGLLLAVPHNANAPTEVKVDHGQTQAAADTQKEVQNQAPDQNTSSKKTSVKINSSNSTAQVIAQQPIAIVNPPSTPTPDTDEDSISKGHRGHTRGRSALAPPKRHGLHDLGMHKGDKNEHHDRDEKGEVDDD